MQARDEEAIGRRRGVVSIRGFVELVEVVRDGELVGLHAPEEEAREAMRLLSLERPSRFVEAEPITEQELFEECATGVLSSRQSTNYRGQRQVSFGPEESAEIATLLRRLDHLDAEVLDLLA